ncbi:MAG: hypothetical protein JNK34_14035, partial [Tabrizicola sp.]|nr:hypothetical protein [Tabrizicola sp.]
MPSLKGRLSAGLAASLVLLLGGLVVAFFVFDLGQYLNLATLKASQDDIAAYRAAKPLLAAGVYFAVYVVVTSLSLPGAA